MCMLYYYVLSSALDVCIMLNKSEVVTPCLSTRKKNTEVQCTFGFISKFAEISPVFCQSKVIIRKIMLIQVSNSFLLYPSLESSLFSIGVAIAL